MKLKKLTTEQEALIPVIRDRWINQLYNLKDINVEQVTEGIEWLYSLCNLPKPRVIICESLLEAQLTIHMMKPITNVGANVWANVRANVWANVRDNVGANVVANVVAKVVDNVGDNVRDNVRDNVVANVGAKVGANVRDNVVAKVRLS